MERGSDLFSIFVGYDYAEKQLTLLIKEPDKLWKTQCFWAPDYAARLQLSEAEWP
jgi:hypothetical protein